MNCFIEMVDCSTGEILYNRNLGLAFAIGVSNDIGMTRLREVLESAIKGARIKRVPLQVRFCFTEPQPNMQLPFKDINEFKTPYEIKPF